MTILSSRDGREMFRFAQHDKSIARPTAVIAVLLHFPLFNFSFAGSPGASSTSNQLHQDRRFCLQA